MRKGQCIAVLLALAMGSPSFAQNNVLLVPHEGLYYDLDLMLADEVGIMVPMLEAAGCRVTIATVSGRAIVGKTTTLQPDLKLSEVDINDYQGVLLPCMSTELPGRIPDVEVGLVKRAYSMGIPIAAQVSSVFVLGAAGILEGKRYALHAGMVPKGIYSGTGVVQDGNIITSGTCPYMARQYGRRNGTPELTELFIKALEEQRLN